MEKIFKKNNGFSLIELLVVIAIIGVISILAFSMFSGVLQNSRKKSDVNQALIIEKAVTSYMLQSNDYKLEHLRYSGYVVDQSMDTKPSSELIFALQHTITCTINGNVDIYPILNPKSGSIPSTSTFAPIWNNSNGGKYVGYKIEVDPANVTCHVTPVTSDADAKVFIN